MGSVCSLLGWILPVHLTTTDVRCAALLLQVASLPPDLNQASHFAIIVRDAGTSQLLRNGLKPTLRIRFAPPAIALGPAQLSRTPGGTHFAYLPQSSVCDGSR